MTVVAKAAGWETPMAIDVHLPTRKIMSATSVTRRQLLRGAGVFTAMGCAAPSYAWAQAIPADANSGPGQTVIPLEIDSFPFVVNGRTGSAIAVNKSVPGPLIRLRQGQQAVIQVNNRLAESTSIHWHGVIVPPPMDGVPGVSFAGIPAKGSYTYRFPVTQSGTYWAHSHSGGQELLGLYMPLIIDPIDPEPFGYERDYVVMLSDWSFESPGSIMSKLKKQAGYYNYQKRTTGEFASDASRSGLVATMKERLTWSKMRMDPTDFSDVTASTYSYLLNGLTPTANWTGLFHPGERMRLRFIAAGSMTYFDIRIPGLKMTVVQADGQNIQPVEVAEFRIAPGETFDVIVQPENQPYTLFAESLDRSGFACGTLAPAAGMSAAIPPPRPRPLRTMIDMGMGKAGMEGMVGMNGIKAVPAVQPAENAMPGMDMPSAPKAMPAAPPTGNAMPGMDMSGPLKSTPAAPQAGNTMPGMDMGRTPAADSAPMSMPGTAHLQGASLPGSSPVMHGPGTHGRGNSSIAMSEENRLGEPGSGFENATGKVLVYADLRSVIPQTDRREPEREIELHLTGNMERYMWSFNGKKYSDDPTPIPFRYGERLRLILVNDTMMEHPIHLHGMWMELENGGGEHQPRKHTVSVKPAERLTVAITADAPGRWAFHCHLLLHMEMGMFRVVEVSPATEKQS
jgi:CopA family copper-resistance protein